MPGWAGQGDSPAALGLSASGSEEKTCGHLALCGAGQISTIMLNKCMIWYGTERDSGSCPMGRGTSEEEKEVRSGLMWVALLPPRAMVLPGPAYCWRPWLLLGPMSGFMALMQPQSLYMSMAPDTTKDWKDRAVQSWPHPSLAAALGRTQDGVLHLIWAAQ